MSPFMPNESGMTRSRNGSRYWPGGTQHFPGTPRTPMAQYPPRSCCTEESLRITDPVGQRVHLGVGVVYVERGTGARLDAQCAVQRPGAVMAGAHSDAELVEYLTDIVRVNPVDVERHRPAAVLGRVRAEYAHSRDAAECLERVRGERLLVRRDVAHPECGQVVAG